MLAGCSTEKPRHSDHSNLFLLVALCQERLTQRPNASQPQEEYLPVVEIQHQERHS